MIEKFLNDQQEPKSVEKVYTRLVDLLSSGEEILYIAVQKKPVVNLAPECVALTNKRVFFFSPANLGLSMKFVDFVWKDVLDVSIKEEIWGAIFSITTINRAEMSVDYLPKVQARKLYQYGQDRKEIEREERRQRELEEKRAASGSVQIQTPATPVPTPEPILVTPPVIEPEPPIVEEPQVDELTEKLKKLKLLFDNSLISQEDYNQKKMELLNNF